MQRRFLAVLVAGVMMPGLAQAENLPWLNQSPGAAPQGSAPAPINTAPLPWNSNAPMPAPAMKAGHKRSAGKVPVMAAAPMQGNVEGPQTRELDDRKLNSIAEDFYAISPTSPNAVAKLGVLQKRAADFKKVLDGRSYGAHDISSDLSRLQVRIADAKKKAAAAAATQPPTVAAIPKVPGNNPKPAPVDTKKSADKAAQEALDMIKKMDSK